MKKLFCAMVMAIVAVAFTACDDTADLTDAELIANIQTNALYGGTDSDGDYLTLAISGTTYELYYGESKKDTNYEMFSNGTWNVVNGVMTCNDVDGKTTFQLEISNSGKTLTKSTGNLTFTLKKK